MEDILNKLDQFFETEKGKTMTVKSQWAVENKQTGKIARTRESNYSKKALFETRSAARAALRDGKVYSKPEMGRVVKRTTSVS